MSRRVKAIKERESLEKWRRDEDISMPWPGLGFKASAGQNRQAAEPDGLLMDRCLFNQEYLFDGITADGTGWHDVVTRGGTDQLMERKT